MNQDTLIVPVPTVAKVTVAKKTSKKVKLLEIEQSVTFVIVDKYTISREPYKHTEFIPTSLINMTLTHHFPSAEILEYFTDTHQLCKIRVKDLLGPQVKNWEHNRPPDMARCPDIARYIYNSKKQIDTMIYLTYTNNKECFEVLDGIHRLTALKIIYNENSRPLELLCPGEFGSNNDADWLYNQYIIVNIRFNAHKGELIELFETLNKCQIVPDLYIKDTNKDKRLIIDTIVNDWQENYKNHFQGSDRPILANTNRNKFVDLLDKVYEKYQLDETGEPKLRQLLAEANNKIAGAIPSKASITMRLKCKESGCFLFLLKNDKLEKLINRL
jgi:hypothetical protein